jgi:hypothetical protein
MRTVIAKAELPAELTIVQAVDAAYADQLARVATTLQRVATLIECETDLVPSLFLNLRSRLRAVEWTGTSVPGNTEGARFSGAHLNACAAR